MQDLTMVDIFGMNNVDLDMDCMTEHLELCTYGESGIHLKDRRNRQEEKKAMLANIPNLKGKVAVVTGGGGVLCGEMAKELARQGMKVAILNRTYEKAQRVVEDIQKAGGDAIAVACDVVNVESVTKAEEIV